MKNTVVIAMTLAMVLSLGVVGCGGSSSQTGDTSETEAVATDDTNADAKPTEPSASGEAPAPQFDSMADAFEAGDMDGMSTWDESRYIYIYREDTRIVRVIAELSKETYDELVASNFDGETIDALVGPLPVASVNLYDLPSQDSLSALEGKTGQELMDAGFTMDSLSHMDDATYCMASNYPFSYMIWFTGAVSNKDTDDVAETVKDMVVAYVVVGTLSEDAMYE